MSLIRQTAGIWGPIGFCCAANAAARRQPGYSHRSHHMSGLAARGQRSATVMIPGFLALGASSLLMPTPNTTLARMARVAGLTTLAAGLIQVSEPRCPQPGTDPAATASDAGHALASIATFALWTAMPIVAHRQTGPAWYRVVSGALGLVSSAGLVAAGVTTRTESPHKGLAQRAFLGAVFAWHIATAISIVTKPATFTSSQGNLRRQ
jgi:hypothetical protein